jgi:hypothetical protein
MLRRDKISPGEGKVLPEQFPRIDSAFFRRYGDWDLLSGNWAI